MEREWLRMSVSDLGRGIGAGEIDPVELTEAALAAIEAHPLRDRIYARVTEERALTEARAARERARKGLRLGLLDGVPVSWKDLYDTAGIATEAGSRLLAGRVPERDARVLATATMQGLVCLGKTHMTELAFSGLGLNPVTQSPPCVNDPEAVSGGSSSGAATSVAFGLAAAAVGSDTGGSVRLPAAWNDLVGLKTTSGRLSLEGVVPLCPKFDTVGPLCRTVEDAAAMLAALEGSKPADLEGARLRGARLLVLENGLRDARPEPRAAFERSVARLQDAGARVESASLDIVDEALELAGVLYTTEAWAVWGETIEARPDDMFEPVRRRFETGKTHSGAAYVRAWRRLDEIRREYGARMAGFDAAILPASPILPPRVERLETDHNYFVTENLLGLRNTRMGNLMGGAGLTVPTGIPSCGLMFIGAPMGEEALLRLGAACERALT